MAWTLRLSFCAVQTTLTVLSNPPALVISGVKRSSTPLPDGPLTMSYAGCLSAQAVRPCSDLTTSKMVLLRIASCGNNRTHFPFTMWFGSIVGSILFCETPLMYLSMDSSKTFMFPGPAGFEQVGSVGAKMG